MPNQPSTILDDFRACSFPDCPNPTLIDRMALGGKLNDEEEKILAYYLDECQRCREYAEQRIQSSQKKKE